MNTGTNDSRAHWLLLAVAVSCLWIVGCRQTTRTRELPQFQSKFTVTPADLRIPVERLPLFNYPLIDAQIGVSEVRLLKPALERSRQNT